MNEVFSDYRILHDNGNSINGKTKIFIFNIKFDISDIKKPMYLISRKINEYVRTYCILHDNCKNINCRSETFTLNIKFETSDMKKPHILNFKEKKRELSNLSHFTC